MLELEDGDHVRDLPGPLGRVHPGKPLADLGQQLTYLLRIGRMRFQGEMSCSGPMLESLES